MLPECRVPWGPAAREIATREPAARSGRSRSPPVPSGPYGTRHAGCPWCWCSAAVRLSAVARAGGLEWCLSVGCLRARPPARSPHASLLLGVVDLEARPCPPGPTAPATLAARGVDVSCPPPSGTATVPSEPYGTRHAGCPWCCARRPRACGPQLEVVVWCLSVGCLRARPPARSPHANLRLGVIDLEARPCPPGPTAPATLAAYDVVPGQALPHRNPGVRP